MAESNAMDNRTLLRRTLIVGGAMGGSCVLFIGTLALVASAIVGSAVGSGEAADGGGSAVPSHAATLSPAPAGSKAPAAGNPIHRK